MFSSRVIEALEAARIAFVTAVNSDGQPQTSPVWYVRDGDQLIVYNRAVSQRLRSIAINDRVAFNLRGDRGANGMLSIEGRASVDPDLPPPHEYPEYVARYGPAMVTVSGSQEGFSADYSVGIRIRPTRIRSWGIQTVIDAEY